MDTVDAAVGEGAIVQPSNGVRSRVRLPGTPRLPDSRGFARFQLRYMASRDRKMFMEALGRDVDASRDGESREQRLSSVMHSIRVVYLDGRHKDVRFHVHYSSGYRAFWEVGNEDRELVDAIRFVYGGVSEACNLPVIKVCMHR
jgi:hypothetical protein